MLFCVFCGKKSAIQQGIYILITLEIAQQTTGLHW